MNTNRIRSVLVVALLVSATAPSFAADASTCYTVGDMDARNDCLAKARHEPSMCYAIQRADMRARCLAEVRQ
jgi:hypothetical protein